MRLFATIDQSAGARHAGFELRETVLLIFGDPGAGTAVMDAVPLAALDLPLKVLIWADGDQTKISYTAPAEPARHYELSTDLASKSAGIDILATAVSSSERQLSTSNRRASPCRDQGPDATCQDKY